MRYEFYTPYPPEVLRMRIETGVQMYAAAYEQNARYKWKKDRFRLFLSKQMGKETCHFRFDGCIFPEGSGSRVRMVFLRQILLVPLWGLLILPLALLFAKGPPGKSLLGRLLSLAENHWCVAVAIAVGLWIVCVGCYFIPNPPWREPEEEIKKFFNEHLMVKEIK